MMEGVTANRGTKRPNSAAMAEPKKRKLGLLLFLTVQVVSLAVLEYQQQADASQAAGGGECPSATLQLLIPVLTLWESMRSTAIIAALKRRRRSPDRSPSGDEDSESEVEDGEEGPEDVNRVGIRGVLENGNVMGANKRRGQAGSGATDGGDQLAGVLIGCGEAVQDHALGHDWSSKNGELDRLQRKEHSDQLIGVLENLATIVGQIAEKW